VSDTIVDMPKVTQMLDAGWQVLIYRGPLGSYEVRANHRNPSMISRALKLIQTQMESIPDALPHKDEYHIDDDGDLMTDDFTPQQAMTRMAYKVQGEVI
jgi:hypothetical protein